MSWAELYIDDPAHGAWNMAVDQALLEHCEATGRVTLRLYQWEPATLSLGYFQRFGERETHRPSIGLDLVRRATGGGAIVHDQELTYSLCMPSEERWSRANRELYDAVHRAILATLADAGIEAGLYAEEGASSVLPAPEARKEGAGLAGCGAFGGKAAGSSGAARFLCFERRSPGDVILNGYKIGGSAQRRGKQALLQHGSILLRKSVFAPELPGIEDLAGKWLDSGLFGEKLLAHIGRELNLQFQVTSLSAALSQRAKEVEESTFGSPAWNRNR